MRIPLFITTLNINVYENLIFANICQFVASLSQIFLVKHQGNWLPVKFNKYLHKNSLDQGTLQIAAITLKIYQAGLNVRKMHF